MGIINHDSSLVSIVLVTLISSSRNLSGLVPWKAPSLPKLPLEVLRPPAFAASLLADSVGEAALLSEDLPADLVRALRLNLSRTGLQGGRGA